MIDLKNASLEAEEDIKVVSEWCDDLYSKNFATYFKDARSLFERLKSKNHPITDEELSWILITLPIHLFDAAETLNRFRLNMEIVKLRYKRSETELIKQSEAKTATLKREEAESKLIDDKLLIVAYDTIISQVDKEISLSKELIMGAKKIWDSRRKSDETMPVSEIETSDEKLPDYKKSYIRGGSNI